MTYEETSIILNRNMGQVKALLHNGRKKLKTILEKEFNTEYDDVLKVKQTKEEVKHDEINGRVHK